MALEREYETYLREKPRMLKEGLEGKWLLIVGDSVDSEWETFSDAFNAGFNKGFVPPFMVQQLWAKEPVFSMPMSMYEFVPIMSGQVK